jgi:hypothetical protein
MFPLQFKLGNYVKTFLALQISPILNLKMLLFRYIKIFLLTVNTESFITQAILIQLSQLMELSNGLMISTGISLKSGNLSMLTHKLLVT